MILICMYDNTAILAILVFRLWTPMTWSYHCSMSFLWMACLCNQNLHTWNSASEIRLGKIGEQFLEWHASKMPALCDRDQNSRKYDHGSWPSGQFFKTLTHYCSSVFGFRSEKKKSHLLSISVAFHTKTKKRNLECFLVSGVGHRGSWERERCHFTSWFSSSNAELK